MQPCELQGLIQLCFCSFYVMQMFVLYPFMRCHILLQQTTGAQVRGKRIGFSNVYQRLKTKRTIIRSATPGNEPTGTTDSEDSDDVFMTPRQGVRVLPQNSRPRTRSVTRDSKKSCTAGGIHQQRHVSFKV